MNLWFEFTPKECTSKCLYTGGYPILGQVVCTGGIINMGKKEVSGMGKVLNAYWIPSFFKLFLEEVGQYQVSQA